MKKEILTIGAYLPNTNMVVVKQCHGRGKIRIFHTNADTEKNAYLQSKGGFLFTWTMGVDALSGLKVNLQPKERADSDRKEADIIGLKILE